MDLQQLRNRLKEKGLKVTPQRIAVYEALVKLVDHPSADSVAEEVRKHHPNIATGTVYKVLDTFARHNLIKKVKTEKDIMRYDAIMDQHHHIYCEDSERIEDYFDSELDTLLMQYFKDKRIAEFKISEIKTQIVGRFIRN